MWEKKEALDVAEDNIQEVEEATTDKEEPKTEEGGNPEAVETPQEDKKSPKKKEENRWEKLVSKLDEKDARIAALEEKNDKSEAKAVFGEQIFENEKVLQYKENIVNKDGTPISWSQAAEMAWISQASAQVDSYYIPWTPKKTSEAEQKELTIAEQEAQLEKLIAEGKITI